MLGVLLGNYRIVEPLGEGGMGVVYSLGCVLFNMACGRTPFLGHAAADIVGAHLHAPAPDPRSNAPDLPPRLVELLGTMLAKEPSVRPRSARRWRPTRRPSRARRTPRTPSRRS